MAVTDTLERMKRFLDFDPKTQDGLVNITTWFIILIYFLYLHLFIVPIRISKFEENYALYLFVLFIPAAIGLLLFSGDSIAYAENNEARFFQAQFPDKYVAEKFKIDMPKARLLWFKAVDKLKDEERIKRTFQRGYTCRLVYYTRRAALAFFGVAIATLLLTSLWRYYSAPELHGWREFSVAFLQETNLLGKLFYVAHVGGLWIYFSTFHRPRMKNPSGVWIRWKEINDRNKAWIDRFSTLKEFEQFVGI